jgi:hypothetical protein
VSTNLAPMFKPIRRLWFCAAAFALLCTGCATAHGFELSRVQSKDVEVLPGAAGFMNPLTGIVSYSPQEWQQRPILAVKIGNSSYERPQAGLDGADVVFEELVEGGVTRFMALYSTNQSARVGPVRSVRTVDHKILQPLGALFAYSGGVPPVVDELRETPGVIDVGGDVVQDAYRRDSSRTAPYNLYTTTDQLWSGREGSPPAKPMFEFLEASEDASAGGEADANEIEMSFAGNGADVRYEYDEDAGVYNRYTNGSAHMVEGVGGAEQLSFRNVLVQEVRTSRGSTVDRGGELTTDIAMLGSGSAVLFRGGRAFRGTWHRPSVDVMTTFVSSSGQPLEFAPGETIIALMPRGRDVVVR